MFKYHGSKQSLARTYQPPVHDVVVEPFAGAAHYAISWMLERPSLQVILVEKNPLVVETWHRLLAMTPADILAIPDVTKGDRCSDPLISYTAGAQSALGAIENQGSFQVTEWTADRWPKRRQTYAHKRGRINPANITIIEGDFTQAPDIPATWFIDPPYQKQGIWYRNGSQALDYEQLAEWCQSRQGQVIVCEATPADWLPFTTHQTTQNQAHTSTVELVWESHPQPTLF